MAGIRAFIVRHAVLTYYLLTFVISWGGILLVIGGPSGIPGAPADLQRLFPLAIVAMLAGPAIAGILMTGLVAGRAGFRDLLSRLLRWRVGARWYAVALLTAPLVFMLVLLILSLFSPEFLPGVFVSDNAPVVLLLGLTAGLVVGIFEELGWTGFVTPRLRLRYSILATGLIMGVLWGAWHLLTNDFWSAGESAGGFALAPFVLLNGLGILFGQLLAYRVLMVWVYDRTDGSLLLAILMHASLTASTLIFGPAITGVSLLVYDFALAVAMWLVVIAVLLTHRGQLTADLTAGARRSGGDFRLSTELS